VNGVISLAAFANHENNVDRTRANANARVFRQLDPNFGVGQNSPSPPAGVMSGQENGLQQAETAIRAAAELPVEFMAAASGMSRPSSGGASIPGGGSGNPKALAPTSVRPSVNSSLPGRVTQELPAGGMRTPAEVKQARNFFERNRDAARKWWEQRTGQTWPKEAVHDSHPRALKDGGDPLFIEPSYENPWGPHIGPGDFSRWGTEGGFWKHKKNQ